MKEMLHYLKPYWRGLLAATIAVAISTVCDLLLPAIMSEILNKGVYRADFAYIVRCCAVMAAVALVGLGTVLLGSKISNDVVASFCADLRAAVFRKVNQMSFEEFGELGTAALVTRCSHDVETVSWIAAELSGTVVMIPVLFFGGVVLSLRKDVALSLTMLAFVPVILAIVIFIGKKIDGIWEVSDKFVDRQNEIMRERLRGIRVIRAFNSEKREHERVSEATRIMASSFIRGNVAMGAISPLATFLLNVAAVLIVYLGGWRMETSTGLTGGDIFAIVQYVSLVSAGVVTGAFAIISFPQAEVAAKRIGQVLHAKGMADPIERQDITLSGDIDFDHVTFRYEGAAEAALKDITLSVKKGQRAAIIGGTGSGAAPVGLSYAHLRGGSHGRNADSDPQPPHHAGQHQLRAAKRDHLFRHHPGQCAHGQAGSGGRGDPGSAGDRAGRRIRERLLGWYRPHDPPVGQEPVRRTETAAEHCPCAAEKCAHLHF